MRWLIDGYNVCFAVGLLSPNVKEDDLRCGRIGLLSAVREGLPEEAVRETVVVFDSRVEIDLPEEPEVAAFPGQVRFAAKYREADDLIEELIRREPRPEKLTVVSTDSRIAKAAKRRRAISMTSEAWWDALRDGKLLKVEPSPQRDEKPTAKPLPDADDTAKWSEVFAIDEETLREEIAAEPEPSKRASEPLEGERASTNETKKGAKKQPKRFAASEPDNAVPDAWKDFAERLERGDVEVGDVPSSGKNSTAANPFGEGYAEDLLADQTWLKDDKTIKRPGEGKRKS